MRKMLIACTILASALLTACDSGDTSTTTTSGPGGGGTGGGGDGGTGGATGGGGAGGTGGGDGCVLIAPGDLTVDANGNLSSASIMVEGAAEDLFRIEFYELNGPQMNGSYDLGAGIEANYASCDHCVLVYADLGDMGAGKIFFQKSGTMKLESVQSPPGPLTVGSIADVTLVEVTINPDDFTSTEVPGGACLRIDAATWDTTPVNGTDCTSAEDCSNPYLQVCDVASQKCVDGQCDGDMLNCAMDETCVAQVDTPVVGACYKTCTPFTSGACDAGYECVNSSLDGSEGACYHTGAGATGDMCTTIDVGTACAAGSVCSANAAGDTLCQEQCTIFAMSPGCDAGTDCTYSGLCVGSDGLDPAAVGGTCMGATSEFTTPCGPSGGAYRGLCYNEMDGDPLLCKKLCRLAMGFETDCPAAEFCYDSFGASVGICLPDPVCGNGMIEPGETCEDGNTMAGDGCSDLCVVEPDFYCMNAVTAMLGANSGDTSMGPAAFSSACNLGGAGKEVFYTFTPAADGMLHLVLESATDQGISVRTNCTDAATELDCADANLGGTDEVLDVPVTAGTPVTIIVDGYSSADDAGPFTLTLSLM